LPSTSIVEGRSVAPRTSRTVNCNGRPTCCAARPTPLLAYMVSNMSAMSFLISGVIFSSRAPFWRRAGWPYLTISRSMALGRGCGGGLHFGGFLHEGGNLGDGRALAGAHIVAAGGDAGEQAH